MTVTKHAYVIGFDPGSSTGVVTWDNVEYKLLTEFVGSPTATFTATESVLTSLVSAGIRPTLVAERFDLSAATLRKSREGIDDAINILGMLWCFAQHFDLPFVKVMRSSSKNFVKDEALKKHNIWPRSRHSRDALRVVLTYLASVDQDFVKNYWVK